MKKNNLILAVLLILWLTACNPAGNSTTGNVVELPTIAPTPALSEVEVAVPIQEAVVESETPPEPESGAETAADTAVNLDDFLLYDEPPGTNYLTTLEFYMTAANADGSTGQVGRVFAEGARTLTPAASLMVFNMEGGAGGGLGETMTVAQIADAFYYVMPPNDCISMAGQSGFENPFDLFLDTGGFLTGEVQRVLPNQTINGVDSRHYTISPENIASLAVYEVYQADLFVAEDGRYVTRLLINGYGVNEVVSGDSLQEGEIYYELNFIPTADVPAITPPAGCGESNAIAADYPTLPDAAGIISMEGLYSYETQTPLAEAVAFYIAEMESSGWTLTQEIVQASNATLTFTGSGGTVMVSMGPGQSGGTQVGIIPMP